MDAQKLRRNLNKQLLELQSRLRSLRDEMDRLSRTDSRFLKLFTEEHEVLKREVDLMNEYKLKEDEERELFFFLSASLRDSQEKERARVERIKYLQLGLSLACTTLGIISAFLLSYFRNSSIRQVLRYEQEQFSTNNQVMQEILLKQAELQAVLSQRLLENDTNNIQLHQSLNEIIKKTLEAQTRSIEIQTNVEPVKNIESNEDLSVNDQIEVLASLDNQLNENEELALNAEIIEDKETTELNADTVVSDSFLINTFNRKSTLVTLTTTAALLGLIFLSRNI